MHFCRAKIAIAGDNMNVYAALEFDPVSWPEVFVLQQVHGETAVTDVEPFAVVEQSPRAERQRLAEKYKEDVIADVFGGKQVPNEMEAPRVTIQPGITWLNPITRQVEVTGPAPTPEPEPPVMESETMAAQRTRTERGQFAPRG